MITDSKVSKYSSISGVGIGSSAQYFLPVFEINFCTSSSLRGAKFSSRHRFDGPVDGFVGGLDGLVDGLVDRLIDGLVDGLVDKLVDRLVAGLVDGLVDV